jgi:hypothetical protein
MSKRTAERQREAAIRKAKDLLRAHPGFQHSQVQIYERTQALERELSGKHLPLQTEARLEFALRRFDIQSSAYLDLVTDPRSQEAYNTILGELTKGAWQHFTGFDYLLLPAAL